MIVFVSFALIDISLLRDLNKIQGLKWVLISTALAFEEID